MTRLGWILCGWIAAGTALARPPGQAAGDIPMQKVELETMDRQALSPADAVWLTHEDFSWKHMETEHFTLHFERQMFASKVARLGEQFYQAISADLPSLQDRISPAKSHIFIFRKPQDWQVVVSQTQGLDEWAASFVRGQAMFLQEIGNTTSEKMETLAHEMTHLVFNRFVPVRLPLWLNEGLAEYYGRFAYRAAKGMGQSRRASFRPLQSWMPLNMLLSATSYPTDPKEVHAFYQTSEYLVGFLLLDNPRESWDRFFGRVLQGEAALPALLESYGWADVNALEKAFARFAR